MPVTLVSTLLVLLIVALVGCAPAPSRSTGPAGQAAQDARPAVSRTMTMVVRYEATELHAKVVAGGPSQATKRAFNAALAFIDGTGAPRPYLADSLPQLNSESWKVSPDGRMETTYRLRPNLTWHDGQSLTAEDFAFAYRVYTAPGLGAFIVRPVDQIEEVSAADPRTVVIRWRNLFPEAGAIATGDLDPLPRHILEGALNAHLQDPASQDVFMGNSYWTTSFVGPGPYKLERWDPGASLQGVAFDGHALGRPKIERIVIKPIPDENTAMTNLLAGSADIASDNALRFEHAVELKRQWDPGQRGTALMRPGTRHYILVQSRPELLKTQALADLRVRRAMMHALDRQALNDAIFEGQRLIGEHFIAREMPYFNDVERAITRYPFDPTRVAQLMGEAGYTKDRTGFFANAAGERLRPHAQSDGAAQFEREMTLIQDTWGRIGIEIDPFMLPAVQVRNNEVRNTFPDLYITSTTSLSQGSTSSLAPISARRRTDGPATTVRVGRIRTTIAAGWRSTQRWSDPSATRL